MDFGAQRILHEEIKKYLLSEKFHKGEKMDKEELNQPAELASKESSDKARRLVNSDYINLSAVAQEVDKDAASNQSAQSSVRKEVLGLNSDGKPDGKPMRADYVKAIMKLASQL